MSEDLDKKAYLDWLEREMEEIYGSSNTSKFLEEGRTPSNVKAYVPKIIRIMQRLIQELRLSGEDDAKILKLIEQTFGLSARTVEFYFQRIQNRLLK